MPLPRLSHQLYSKPPFSFFEGHEPWDLTAPYQRGSVWSARDQRQLIRSMLMELPIGVIYANDRGGNSDRWTVIDGKQRIEAIRAFEASRLAVPAEWFEEADIASGSVGVDGVRFCELTQRAQFRFSHHGPISVYLTRVETEREEATIFELLNMSGERITDDDLERARTVADGTPEGSA